MLDKVLLGDKPEFAERIENNYSLIGRISDILEQQICTCLTETILLKETQPPMPSSPGDNLTSISRVDNSTEVAASVLAEICDFVNQNYISKKDYAAMMDRLPLSTQDDVTDAWGDKA